MSLTNIENKLKLLVNVLDRSSFIYHFLESFGLPKASISRLQKGSLNLSKIPGEVSWKKKLFFKEELNNDLHITISNLRNEIKHNQRFVIVTDYETLLAIDTLTQDQLDIPLVDLYKHYDFFLPLAGMEKATHTSENPADVKAAEKMAKLFDEIKKDNPDSSIETMHNLNIFFTRLLFCYFAEDTNIFEDNQFCKAVESHTKSDGSDLNFYLNRLFKALNQPKNQRGDIPKYLEEFPYVNGGLFKDEIPCPNFSTKSRQLLIESGDSNNWSAINPDIFGSMFQAVISPEHRGGLGAHYTSVPNIMKVIEPLFLNELKEAFEESKRNKKKLKELLNRISRIKLFDPACGSGNFLIIAYKELRRLEMRIIKELNEFAFTGIHLNNFYGIELDDFAHEIAKLSLWLAEHQMNVEFLNEFGKTNPTLPLQEAGQIICGNACRLNWEQICPKYEGDEIYIMGNPPYKGSSSQNAEQKDDMAIVFKGIQNYKNLDFIAAWFYKGAEFIQNNNAEYCFVSTNSICQGEQVALLWPYVFNLNLEIKYAYTSFKWKNNAKDNAGVSVIIVCVRNINTLKVKYLIYEKRMQLVKNINPYLSAGDNLIVLKRSLMLSELPEMTYGNKAVYGDPLILNSEEKNLLISENSSASNYIKRYIGARELLDGLERWVIWIKNDELINAIQIESIRKRIDEVKKLRLCSSEKGAIELSKKPHQFRDTFETETNSVIIPLTTSERRDYIPLGFSTKQEILSNAVSVIYNADIWIFGVISSRNHMTWLRAVSGRLKTDYRYSSSLVYNTFPFPPISNQRKEELTQCSFHILAEREKHPEKTLAQYTIQIKCLTALGKLID